MDVTENDAPNADHTNEDERNPITTLRRSGRFQLEGGDSWML